MIAVPFPEEQNKLVKEALEEFRQKIGAKNVMVVYSLDNDAKLEGESQVAFTAGLMTNCPEFTEHTRLFDFVIATYRQYYKAVFTHCIHKLFYS